MRKLNVNFSHSFNGKVWNIISHQDRNLLLIEVRDTEKFTVSFSILDVLAGRLIMEDRRFDEPWWIGVSWFGEDMIIFHTWPSQDNPDFRDYFAFDIVNDKILWTLNDASIFDMDLRYIQVLHRSEGEVRLYDRLSGKEAREAEPENHLVGKENNLVKKAFHYGEGSDHFSTVRAFLKKVTARDAVKGVDYYENAEVIIISCYFLNDNQFDNHLFVFDHEGDVLLDTVLDKELNGISTDTFFIYGNNLIFVEQKRDFFIYQLP